MFSNQAHITNLIQPFLQFILFGLQYLRYQQLQSKSEELYKILTHDDLIYTEIKERYLSIPISIYVFYKKTFENETISKKIKQLPFLQEKDKIIFIFYSQNNSYYYYDIDDNKTENFIKQYKMIEYYIQKYMKAFFKKAEENRIKIDFKNKSSIQYYIKSYRSKELKTKTTSSTITRKKINIGIDIDDEYYIVSDNSDNIEYDIKEKEIDLLKKESENFINNWKHKENVIEKPKENINNEKTKINDDINEDGLKYKYDETNFEDFDLLLKEDKFST
ncbi:6645_t:CDS:2 [Dentiscutata heterogama]|uniref:6645_t:CDS:1 n=1 Tax=Dentiscutata heterogama TaxID=1316150 RepID=A0ACA9LFR9_9GLOM|nr:6645_t:CDS:2 [Dentiscutata heterogama]